MAYAVELLFDSEAEQRIVEIWKALSAAGVSSTLLDLGSRPHISLAVWDELDVSDLGPKLASFARSIRSFSVGLNTTGSFPDTGAVYLAPKPTQKLHAIHSSFFRQIRTSEDEICEYYLPDQWVPHCALAVDLPPEKMREAVEVCREAHQPIEAHVEQIGVVEFRPVKELLVYELE